MIDKKQRMLFFGILRDNFQLENIIMNGWDDQSADRQ
jgi:hypothetical protein